MKWSDKTKYLFVFLSLYLAFILVFSLDLHFQIKFKKGIVAVFFISFLDPFSTYLVVKAGGEEMTDWVKKILDTFGNELGIFIVFIIKFIVFSIIFGFVYLLPDIVWFVDLSRDERLRYWILLTLFINEVILSLWNSNNAINAWKYSDSSQN
jgi:hypothetical protein